MKFLIFLLFGLNAGNCLGTVTVSDITTRLSIVRDLVSTGKTDEAIRLSREIFKDAQQVSCSFGIIEAGLNIASILNQRFEFKNSNEYLKIVERENARLDCDHYDYKINKLWGDRYFNMGMYHEAEKRYKRNSDNLDLFLDGWAYGNIANCLAQRKLQDSAVLYRKRAYRLLKENRNSEAKSVLIGVCVRTAEDFIRYGKLDSARIYLNEGLMLAKETGRLVDVQCVKVGFGNYALAQNKIGDAILFFEEAKSMAKLLKDTGATKSIYRSLASAYKLNRNTVKYVEYLELSQGLSDHVTYQNNLKFVFDTMVSENEINHRKKVNDLIVVGSLSGISLILMYIFYQLASKLRGNRLPEKVKDLSNSSGEFEGPGKAISLTLLDELARSKDPSFFLRFMEVYPDFNERLIQRYPRLNLNDIEFCAYLRMNFDTKEIAVYANMTVRSVEAKKYRIRKKMGISSTENMNLLMMYL